MTVHDEFEIEVAKIIKENIFRKWAFTLGEKGCEKRQGYHSYKSSRRSSVKLSGGYLISYECPFCKKWHIRGVQSFEKDFKKELNKIKCT